MSDNYRRVYVSSSAYELVRVVTGVENSVTVGTASSSSASSRSEGAKILAKAVSADNYSVESSSLQIAVDYPVYARISQPQISPDHRTLLGIASGRNEYSIVYETVGVGADAPSVIVVEEGRGVSYPQSALSPAVIASDVVEGAERSEAGPITGALESSVSESMSFAAAPVSLQVYEHAPVGLEEVVVEHKISTIYLADVEGPPAPVVGEAPNIEVSGEVKFAINDLLENTRALDAFLGQAPSVLREALIAVGFSDAPKDLKALLDYYWSKYNANCTQGKAAPTNDLCARLDLIRGVFDAAKFIYEYHIHLRRVEQLLTDIQRGDAWSVGRNPIFRALVKAYEILPTVDDANLRNAILSNIGLSGVEELRQLLRRIALGEKLNDKEITALVLVSKLYDEKWKDLKKYGNFSLTVSGEIESLDPSAYNQLASMAAALMSSGKSIHYVDLDEIPVNVVDAYYAAVLKALQGRGPPEYMRSYTVGSEFREAFNRVLRNINVLGHFSSAVSSAIKSMLVWLGVDESTAEKIAMVGASGVTAFTISSLNVATAGLAAPIILGLVGLSCLSTLAQVGTLTDNPIEKELLLDAFRENLPWIAASIGVAVAAGYAGTKLGSYIEKNITLPMLVKMYNKALDAGHSALASKIRGFLEGRLSQYTAVARLKAEDYEFHVYVDKQGEVTVQLVAKGKWELVHTSKSLSNDFIALLQDQQSGEVLGGIVQKVIPEIKGSKESLERFLSNLEKVASDTLMRAGNSAVTRDVLTLIRDALKDARVLNVLKTGRVLRVVPTSSGAVIDTDVGAYVLVRLPGLMEPYVILTSKSTLGALQLYTTLRDIGVDINGLINAASKHGGAGSWAARVGELDVVFSGGKLVVAKGGSKLAEVLLVGRVLENLPRAAEIVESLQNAGVPYTVVKSVSQGYASGGIVPSVAPVDIALPVANLYQSILEAFKGQGVSGGRTVAITTNRGAVTVNYAWYVGADDANAFEGAVKALSTESMKSVAKAIVQNKLGAELGKGGILYSYVLTIPADKAEQLSGVLNEALNQMRSLVKVGKIAEASSAASRALTSIEAVGGRGAAQVVGQMLLQSLMLASEGREIAFTVPATASSASSVYIPVVLAATGAAATLTEQVAQAKAAASSTMLSTIAQTLVSRGLLALSISKSISEYAVSETKIQLEQLLTKAIADVRPQARGTASELYSEVFARASHTITEVPVQTEVALPWYQTSFLSQAAGDPMNIRPQLELIEEHVLVEVPIENIPSVAEIRLAFNLESAAGSVAVVPVVVNYVVEVPVPPAPLVEVLSELPKGGGALVSPSGLPLVPRLEFMPGAPLPGEERYKHVLEEIVI